MSAISIGEDLIHYEVLGRGRPVVLLHSWLGSWRYWIPTMQQLKINYKVYAIDLYGFGDSVKDPNKYSLEHQIKLLEDFIEKMGIPKMALVGHGLGALVGIEYARRHIDKVPRMLIASAPLFDPGDLDQRATLLTKVMEESQQAKAETGVPETTVMSVNSAMRAALAEAAARKGVPAAITPPTPVISRSAASSNNNLLFQRLITDKKVNPQKLLDMCFNKAEPEYKKLQVDVTKADARAIPSSMIAFDAGEVLDALRRLTIPMVIVHGRNDDVIEAPGDRVWNYLTADKDDSMLPVLLDDVRHFPMLEHERFFRLLTDFLEAQDISKLEIKERWKRRSH